MKDEGYYVVKGWMTNKLRLKGNELNCFAIIYGFSQDEGSRFQGSTEYLQESMGVTRNTVKNVLKGLISRKLVTKHVVENRGFEYHDYSVNLTECQNLTRVSNDTPDDVKICPNPSKFDPLNIDIVKLHSLESIREEEIEEDLEENKDRLDMIFDEYKTADSTKDLILQKFKNENFVRSDIDNFFREFLGELQISGAHVEYKQLQDWKRHFMHWIKKHKLKTNLNGKFNTIHKKPNRAEIIQTQEDVLQSVFGVTALRGDK